MKDWLIWLGALFIHVLSGLFRLFPLRKRVALLSRQSSTLSLDFSMLKKELERRQIPCVSCTAALKTSNLGRYTISLLLQVWYAMTSSVVVVEGYVPAVSIPRKRKGVHVIQIWHALGAIKKFGYAALDTPAGRSTRSARIGHMHRNYDYIIAGGPGAIRAYAESFCYPPARVITLGLPRVDYLFRQSQKPMSDVMSQLISPNTVLYAPTLRTHTESVDWLVKNIHELANACAFCGMNLLVAFHPLTKNVPTQEFSHEHNVVFAGKVRTLDLLPYVTAVITDYSAVAFCAGIVDTPVYFYVPDIDEYRKSPGLFIDPLMQFSANASRSAAELLRNMSQDFERTGDVQAVEKHPDAFLRFCKQYFNRVPDGRCTERIAFLISEIMHGESNLSKANSLFASSEYSDFGQVLYDEEDSRYV